MRIVLITLGIYPIQIGGVEILAFKQLQKLTKRGHEVVCFTKVSRGDKPATPGSTFHVQRLGSTLPVFGQLLFLAGVTLRLLAMRKNIDVIHVQYASYFVIPAYILHRLTGIPYIVGCVGSDLLLWGRKPLWKNTLGRLLRTASYATALSTELRGVLIREYRVPGNRATLIPTPFDVDDAPAAASLRRREGKVVFLGNLKPVKDPMTAVKAFARLHEEMPGCVLVLIGDGPSRSEIADYVSRTGLENHVLLRGSLKHEDAMRELGESDLLVMSSLAEGGPIAAMEAMALGVPVIGTRVGGLKDLITDGVNGLLVPVGGIEALANAMLRVLSDRTLAGRFVVAAREAIAARTWDDTIESYERLYRSAMDSRRPRMHGA